MKTLFIVGIILLGGIVLLAVLYYTPAPAYYLPLEPMPDGSGRRIPDDRLPPLIDKLEVVLKQEGVGYRRESPARLYFKSPPPPAQLREWEVKAGIPNPTKMPNKAPEPTTTSVTSPAAQEPRQP